MVLLARTLPHPAVAAALAMALMPAVLVADQDAEYTADSPAGSPRAVLLAEAGSVVRWWAYESATSHHRPLPPRPSSPHLPVSVAAFVAASRVLRVAATMFPSF